MMKIYIILIYVIIFLVLIMMMYREIDKTKNFELSKKLNLFLIFLIILKLVILSGILIYNKTICQVCQEIYC